MKILLFSDFHAHNWTYNSKVVPTPAGLRNSRLLNQVDVLAEIRNDAISEKVDCVIFCGDMFHTRGKVPTTVFNEIFSAIALLAEVVPVYMIPGNHDFADRAGNTHALQPFNEIPNVRVLENDHLHLKGCSFYFLAYQEDPQDFLDKLENAKEADFLIAHQGVQSGIVGSNLVLMNQHELDPKDLVEPLSRFKRCFFGHYHKHQQIAGMNAYYVGATQQHEWSDANDFENRGWLLFDTESLAMVRRHSEVALRFYEGSKASLMDTKPWLDPRAYVRLTDELPTGDAVVAHLEIKTKKVAEDEYHENFSFSHFDLLGAAEQWIQKKAPQTLNKSKLLEIAKAIL